MTRAVITRPSRELADWCHEHRIEPTTPPLEAFADFMHLDVARGHASAATIRNLWGEVQRFYAWCETHGISPSRATERNVKQYRQHLAEKPYMPGTQAVKLRAVRAFYQAMQDHGLRPDNPAAGIAPESDGTDRADRIKYIPLEGFYRLLTMNMSSRDRALIYLMAIEGLRVGTVARLQITDLDLNAMILHVTAKRGKKQTIHLEQVTADVLRQWLQDRQAAEDEPALFVASDNGQEWRRRENPGQSHGMTARAIRYIVDGHLQAAGLKQPGVSAHSLRHSFATWSVDSGAPVLAVSHKLGHQSLDTTQVYVKVVDAIRQNPSAYLAARLFADRAGVT